MTLEKVKELIVELVSSFYASATVIWAEQVGVKPKPPYVTLKTKRIKKQFFPVKDSENNSYYLMSTILEINLYTKGKEVEGLNTENRNNLATDDLTDFVIYLQSDEVVNFLYENDISISLKGDVNDLSELMNEAKYRYRSMAEFDINWTRKASGRYLVNATNSSGGGTQEMVEAADYSVESVDVEEKED